jgi:hypothetical protein
LTPIIIVTIRRGIRKRQQLTKCDWSDPPFRYLFISSRWCTECAFWLWSQTWPMSFSRFK